VIEQLSRFHQVWVLTHPWNCASVEATLQQTPCSAVEFHYFDLPRWFHFLLRFQGGFQIYAYLWQVRAYFAARRLHQQFRFDVFHHVTYANDWMASFIGALLPVPYIRGPGGGADRTPSRFLVEYSFPDRVWERFRQIAQSLLRRDPFFILGQRRSRAILICSPKALEAIPRRWRYKARLFPVNGLTPGDLGTSLPRKDSNGVFLVVSAGKSIHWKGFSLAVKAFSFFATRRPEARLSILGDGPELPRLESLVAQLKLDNKVFFEKWLPRDEVLCRMRSSDVFLYGSLRDGGGAVVVEAMAAGKPVICLDLAGPAMHVTDACGIKVPANSPEQAVSDMARALDRLYTDKELRHRMGMAGRERAEKLYHWDRLGERLLEIYTDVLQVKPSGVNTRANDESIAAAAGQRRTSF
jgi:glycosyltransferase involved in cell wall biosynthesis